MKKLKAKYCYYTFRVNGYYIFNGSLVYNYNGRRVVSILNTPIKMYIAK